MYRKSIKILGAKIQPLIRGNHDGRKRNLEKKKKGTDGLKKHNF